jgi:hypothetical protein
MASGTRCVERRLQRAVNAAKSALDRPWRRTFLGCSFTRHHPNRRRVSDKALKACKQEGRRLTHRTRGVSLSRMASDLRQYLPGWDAYFGFAEVQSPCKALDSWLRRRRRGDLWKPWGQRRYRELRNRGVSRDLAWNTGKSAHGPWRLSRSPALTMALPGGYFDGRGVPHLYRRHWCSRKPPNRRIRDPYVRWCGRGEVVRPPPIPIRCLQRCSLHTNALARCLPWRYSSAWRKETMAIAGLHLTAQEQTTLETMAQHTGKTPDELIHDAVKQLIAQFQSEDRLRLLQQARGMWKDRTDLPSVADLRREWDRRLGPNDGDPTAD